MWAVAAFRTLPLYMHIKGRRVFLVYNRLFYYFIKPFSLINKHSFVYTSPYLIKRSVLRIGFEQDTIQFKYTGKAYRVSRRNRILHLNFHYPTYKYLVWNNITLKHKKKRKKIFKLIYNTFTNIITGLSLNLFRLRPLNTYTRRGIYLSNFAFYQRKPKTSSKR